MYYDRAEYYQLKKISTMAYNFDEIIDRSHSDCLKYRVLEERWGRTDLLPLWVADMDFRTPHFIIDALRTRLEHEVLGYTIPHPEWKDSIINWQQKRHGYIVKREELTFVPGIVRGIAFVLQSFTQPGDKVMVFSPVYHPFFLVTEDNGRDVVRFPLTLSEANHYEIDLNLLRQLLQGVKVLILSNPHNPGGRVWTLDELKHIAELCQDSGTLVISDEIHADLTLAPYHHVPFACVSETARQNSITFGSPSKAFNSPGIISSYVIVHNEAIRNKLKSYLAASELDEGNMFAQLVTVTAYTQGEEWLEQVKAYIADNIRFVEEYLQENIPQIRPMHTEASFLIYLNCRDLGLSHEQLLNLFIDKAHLALDDGRKFGEEGTGFMRLNVATPLSVLRQALNQLKDALKSTNYNNK